MRRQENVQVLGASERFLYNGTIDLNEVIACNNGGNENLF